MRRDMKRSLEGVVRHFYGEGKRKVRCWIGINLWTMCMIKIKTDFEKEFGEKSRVLCHNFALLSQNQSQIPSTLTPSKGNIFGTHEKNRSERVAVAEAVALISSVKAEVFCCHRWYAETHSAHHLPQQKASHHRRKLQQCVWKRRESIQGCFNWERQRTGTWKGT